MVVGRHPAAVAQASNDLQQLGFTLVQRDRVLQILDEQDPHLNSPQAAEAYFVRNGFLQAQKCSCWSTWMVLKTRRVSS